MGAIEPGQITVYARPPLLPGQAFQPLRPLRSWKAVSITRRLDALAGEFRLTLAPGEKLPLRPGWKVAIDLEDQQVLAGYVDTLNVSAGDRATSITFLGRDLSSDLVDSTPDTDTTEWRELWLDELLRAMVPPEAVTWVMDPGIRDLGPKIPLFRLNAGETFHRAIERACRMRGALAYSLSDGRIAVAAPSGTPGAGNSLIAGAGTRAVQPLVWGKNLLDFDLSYTEAERFSTYIVKGQAGGTDLLIGAGGFQPVGRFEDKTIRSTRTLVVLAETSAWGEDVQARAEWEGVWRAAQSAKITASVPGWRQGASGPLWAVNTLVRIVKEDINLDSELLVNGVTFTKSGSSDGGTSTALELVRPDAYRKQPGIEESDFFAELLGEVDFE